MIKKTEPEGANDFKDSSKTPGGTLARKLAGCLDAEKHLKQLPEIVIEVAGLEQEGENFLTERPVAIEDRLHKVFFPEIGELTAETRKINIEY